MINTGPRALTPIVISSSGKGTFHSAIYFSQHSGVPTYSVFVSSMLNTRSGRCHYIPKFETKLASEFIT